MSPTFGSSRPRRLAANSGTPGQFPRAAADYITTSLSVPKTWGQKTWFPFRTAYQSTVQRGELLGFGDSTMAGSGGDVNYSLMQRIRARGVSAGLVDGGKGAFNTAEPITVYDSPEINSFVSRTGYGGIPDNWNGNGDGHYWDDGTTPGSTLSLQFRTTCARIWYSARATCGQIRYRIDGGSWTTVDTYAAAGIGDKLIYLSGLTAGVTHTIDIENLGTTPQSAGTKSTYLTFAPLNDVGLAVQNFATTGETMNNFTFPWRYWNPLGLTEPVGAKDLAASYSVDTTPVAAGRVKPVLAWLQLGFNDLTSTPTTAPAIAATGVAYFAAVCNAAGIDGLVTSGQLAYNANWPTYGPALFAALRDTAVGLGLAWADTLTPLSGPSLSYAGGATNPHLLRAQYVTQADWLWDNLLGV